MARRRKSVVDYYPHYCDTDKNTSKTLFILENRWGNDGYTFWHKLLETLCRTEGHCFDFMDEAAKELFLAKVRLDERTALEIFATLARIGAIDRELWEVQGRVWCQNLVDNIKDAYRRRLDMLPTRPSIERSLFQPSSFLPSETVLMPSETPDNGQNDVINQERERERESRKGKGEGKGDIPADESAVRIDYERVKADFELYCPSLPKLSTISENRKKHIRALVKAIGLDNLSLLFQKTEASDFLTGRNGKWTGCSFDWIIKPDHALKILEGNYYNKVGSGGQNGGPRVPRAFASLMGEGECVSN